MKMNLIDLTKKLIKIDSHFPNESAIADFIYKWLKENTDCKIQIQKLDNGRINLQIEKGNGDKSILLLGHLDTISQVQGWKTDPLTPIIDNNKLIGLGSLDMKSGISIMLNIMKDFTPLNYKLKLALVVDEENFSIGTHKLIDSGFCDDVEFAMVPEPGFVHGEKGITIGRSGRVTFTIQFKGLSAHGSYPENGINAINDAANFIYQIKNLKLSKNKDLGSSIIYPRFISSEAKGFSVPDLCVVELDSKIVFPDSPDEVLEKIKKFSEDLFKNKKIRNLPDIKFKDRPTPFCSPYQVDKENKYVTICRDAVKEVVGESILFYRNSVADECIIAARLNIPVVTIGPAGENAHGANEYVEIQSLDKVYLSYLKILKNIDNYYKS